VTALERIKEIEEGLEKTKDYSPDFEAFMKARDGFDLLKAFKVAMDMGWEYYESFYAEGGSKVTREDFYKDFEKKMKESTGSQ
jgi:hypothetical protein